MTYRRMAVHRTILVVDVEGFGSRIRTNANRVTVRDGMYRALQRAFSKANISWTDCQHEDCGDGVIVLAPAEMPKSPFVESLPYELTEALREYNEAHPVEERIRLRMALHAGEVNYDDHGMTAAAINLAFRLLDAQPLRAALAESPGVLALITSMWFFDEVVRHGTASNLIRYRPVRVMVKETSAVAWICLPGQAHFFGETPFPATEVNTSVPRQLPAHSPHFVGRAEELGQLAALLDATESPGGGTAMISAINGTAGIGKTALAVHWAHQAAQRFPDGQLYVNLRGFDPTSTPVKPAEAIRGFLDAFQIPAERIPVSLDAQAALYRSVLAGRSVLVILDNAKDVDQVRPLLPGSSTCRVVITSRNQLAGLVTQEGIHLITLDVLTAEEAGALLARHLGHDRVTAEPDVITELIVHCARLPLALATVAARAALNPGLPLRALTDELRNEQIRLDVLDAGDSATSVRAVFSWSYQHLGAPAARMFRLLGVHPGPDISLPAAASLAGLKPRQTRIALDELTRAHLVSQHSPARFAFHDLLRAYASEQTQLHDTEAERRTAIRRLLDHYLHTAYSATRVIRLRHGPITLVPHHPGVLPEKITDYRTAWTWFETERAVLLAIIELAATGGHDTHAWQLPWALQEFLERQGHSHDWATTQHTALTAATRGADLEGQAHAHLSLGRVSPWLGHHDQAVTHVRRALELFTELGDQVGQADTHTILGSVLEQQGHLKEALPHAQQALTLSCDAGYLLGQAKALNNIGWYQALLGEPERALIPCQQSLDLRYELGDRRGEAHTLDSLGYAHYLLNHHVQAITYYQQSLALHRETGARHGQISVLNHLGDAYHSTGDLRAARDTWEQALDTLDQLNLAPGIGLGAGYPDANQIRAKLSHVDRTTHGSQVNHQAKQMEV